MVVRKVSRILVLALALCTVLATTPGLRILCVGSDGHVSIEMAFEECCEDSGSPGSGDLASSCEGCEDLLLELPSVLAKDKGDLDELVTVTWIAPLGERLSDRASACAGPTGSERTAQRAESSTSSVVLRC
jgi:hypothetical protein